MLGASPTWSSDRRYSIILRSLRLGTEAEGPGAPACLPARFRGRVILSGARLSLCYRLVYAEPYDDVRDAIAREKQLKGWRRDKKRALVDATNPGWRDLQTGAG